MSSINTAQVIVAATAGVLTGWTWPDPAVAIAASLPIAVTAAAVADWLWRQEGVRDGHDLHIWPLSTTRTAPDAGQPCGAWFHGGRK